MGCLDVDRCHRCHRARHRSRHVGGRQLRPAPADARPSGVDHAGDRRRPAHARDRDEPRPAGGARLRPAVRAAGPPPPRVPRRAAPSTARRGGRRPPRHRALRDGRATAELPGDARSRGCPGPEDLGDASADEEGGREVHAAVSPRPATATGHDTADVSSGRRRRARVRSSWPRPGRAASSSRRRLGARRLGSPTAPGAWCRRPVEPGGSVLASCARAGRQAEAIAPCRARDSRGRGRGWSTDGDARRPPGSARAATIARARPARARSRSTSADVEPTPTLARNRPATGAVPVGALEAVHRQVGQNPRRGGRRRARR